MQTKSCIILFLGTLASCATTPPILLPPDLSPTAKLILMAAGHNTTNGSVTPDKVITTFDCVRNQANTSDFSFDQILAGVIDEATKQNIGLSHDEAVDAARWVWNGGMLSDIQGIALLALKDIHGLHETLPQSVKQLKDAVKQPKPLGPDALFDIVRRVYQDPTVELEKDTLIGLLENKSFRVALIVFANLHQVPLENRDLDFIHDQLKKKDLTHANIQALVDAGKNRLMEKYSVAEAKTRIDSLITRCDTSKSGRE